MTISFIRVLFILVCSSVGYYLGSIVGVPLEGTLIACLSALVIILIERMLRTVSVRGLSSLVFGLLLGIFMAKLIANILKLVPMGDFFQSVSELVLTIVFSYLGAVMALRGKDEFNIIIPYVRFRREDVKDAVILLDTSAIIDGKIVDICKINFLAGRLVVPRFVLNELQALSDSADDLKRQKGRRGMDLLKSMQADPKIDVHIHEPEMDGTDDVDNKLIKLAKIMDARICTTDYNLAQTATLQGVDVLNIHALVHAVKATVFTGEKLTVKLMKEGKEQHQAIGYLEDGIMVVVSQASKLIGQTVNVNVTSVLNTQAGKMVFASLVDTNG